jgi:pimeloyl-ACP methyl ester carboxylesterase
MQNIIIIFYIFIIIIIMHYLTKLPKWQQRMYISSTSMVKYSNNYPNKLVYSQLHNDTTQIFTLNLTSNVKTQVTNLKHGVSTFEISPDSNYIIYFYDKLGTGEGRWYKADFYNKSKHFLLFNSLIKGWDQGISLCNETISIAIATQNKFFIYVYYNKKLKKILASNTTLRIAGSYDELATRIGLSSDGELLAIESDNELYSTLKVIDLKKNKFIYKLKYKKIAVRATVWAPKFKDYRLAIYYEDSNLERPAILDLNLKKITKLNIKISEYYGNIYILDWFDENKLLLKQSLNGEDKLLTYDLISNKINNLNTNNLSKISRTIDYAQVRPNKDVWYLYSNISTPSILVDNHNKVILNKLLTYDFKYVKWQFYNNNKNLIHGFYILPKLKNNINTKFKPPVIMLMHGGPNYQDTNRWNTEVQLYVDLGFVVALVNYRGSTGYGRRWRTRIIGDIGGPELIDVNAGLDDLIAKNLVDPKRALLGGWSWGGYLTLLGLGKFPDRYIAGIAGVPVGDYELNYDKYPAQVISLDKEYLNNKLPSQLPELMKDRNPVYFAKNIKAPIIFIVGKHDTQCPLDQVMSFIKNLNKDLKYELVLFDEGHGSTSVKENIRQFNKIITFLKKNVLDLK